MKKFFAIVCALVITLTALPTLNASAESSVTDNLATELKTSSPVSDAPMEQVKKPGKPENLNVLKKQKSKSSVVTVDLPAGNFSFSKVTKASFTIKWNKKDVNMVSLGAELYDINLNFIKTVVLNKNGTTVVNGLTEGTDYFVIPYVVYKDGKIGVAKDDADWITTDGWNYYVDTDSGISVWFYYIGDVLQKDWLKWHNEWYYLDLEYGTMWSSEWLAWNNNWYYFHSNGVMAKNGWITPDRYKYYVYPNGVMAVGWVNDGGKWYYTNISGRLMANGWGKIDGNWYFFRPNGEMATGWINSGGYWYYLNPSSGARHMGWVYTGGAWYYLNKNGTMAIGKVSIDGRYSSFNKSGVWLGYTK